MTLDNAMRAFIRANGDRSKMDVPAWAATYPPASPDDVRTCWERIKWEISQEPSNKYEEGDK